MQFKWTGASGAFTILEMLISVAVFTTLMVVGLGIVASQAEMAVEIREHQEEAALRLRFVESCRSNFRLLGPGSSVEFDVYERGTGKTDTYLSMIDVPGAFEMGFSKLQKIDRVVLATETTPDGFAKVGVYYLEENDYRKAKEQDFLGIESRYIPLLPRITRFTWRFYHPVQREWEVFIDRRSPPSMIELTLKVATDSPTMRSVFSTAPLAGGSRKPTQP